MAKLSVVILLKTRKRGASKVVALEPAIVQAIVAGLQPRCALACCGSSTIRCRLSGRRSARSWRRSMRDWSP